jgi:hypothetical protein
VVVAIGVALGLTACNPVSPYAAIVNGNRITEHELVRELNGLRANSAFVTAYTQAQQQSSHPGVFGAGTARPVYTQAFVAAVLGLDIQASVVHTEVLRRRIEPSPAAIADPATASAAAQQFGTDIFGRFPLWLRLLFQQRQAEQDALGKALGSTTVTDADIQKFYDNNPQDFIANQCVAHILVKTQDQANALAAQLRAGADFATLATQSSTDAATAPKGGSLGCGQPGQGTSTIEQDQQFLQAATAAKVGTATAPVQVAQGWDLILVTTRTVTPLTAQIKQAIQQQLQQQAGLPLNQFFQQAAKTLKVTINPTYGHWDPQQLTVVAPASPDPARTGLPSGTQPTTTTTSVPTP